MRKCYWKITKFKNQIPRLEETQTMPLKFLSSSFLIANKQTEGQKFRSFSKFKQKKEKQRKQSSSTGNTETETKKWVLSMKEKKLYLR